MTTRLRPWREADSAALDSLLDSDADDLWLNQFHALHGPANAGPDWRQTLVAADSDDAMIGCATVVTNPLHPGRLPCAVEVSPRHRRQGVGTQLASAIRKLVISERGSSVVLSTKIKASNAAGQTFAVRLGGRRYQRAPGVTVDPSDPVVQQWLSSGPSQPILVARWFRFGTDNRSVRRGSRR